MYTPAHIISLSLSLSPSLYVCIYIYIHLYIYIYVHPTPRRQNPRLLLMYEGQVILDRYFHKWVHFTILADFHRGVIKTLQPIWIAAAPPESEEIVCGIPPLDCFPIISYIFWSCTQAISTQINWTIRIMSKVWYSVKVKLGNVSCKTGSRP